MPQAVIFFENTCIYRYSYYDGLLKILSYCRHILPKYLVFVLPLKNILK